MADRTPIEWTDATWNPITGCTLVSEGCRNCYAAQLAATRLKRHASRAGLARLNADGIAKFTGEVRFNEKWLDQPLRWKKPRMIFVCAHGDLFHESVPDEWIDRVFAVMALAPQHIFQVLTKRLERMRTYCSDPEAIGRIYDLVCDMTLEHGLRVALIADPAHEPFAPPGPRVHLGKWPLFNVWAGTSVEDQPTADARIPHLLATPAAIRWISAEPLLGPIDLNVAWHGENALDSECWGECTWCAAGHPPLHNCQHGNGDWTRDRSGLDWVVAGGESGSGARPMHPAWVRSLRDHCIAAGVPFLFKQWGEWAPQVGAVDGFSISDDPEISRFDHRDWEGGHWGDPYRPMWCDDRDDDTVSRIGKRQSGRLLDGVEHNGFPKVRNG